MFKVIKIKKSILFLCVFIVLYLCVVNFSFIKTRKTSLSYDKPFILIDAGHGGLDGGAVGTKTKVKESDLNLKYAKVLKNYFLSMNYKVQLIRETEFALKNNKEEDMLERKRIIENTNADIFISIHMNRFSQESSKGAQVFYKQEDELSKNYAKCVRDLLVKNIDYSRELILSGDYMVLNSAKCPSILVECGFLSNPLDEERLQTNEYCQKLCYQIFSGTVKFLNLNVDDGI